jgi:hypothetical protein
MIIIKKSMKYTAKSPNFFKNDISESIPPVF